MIHSDSRKLYDKQNECIHPTVGKNTDEPHQKTTTTTKSAKQEKVALEEYFSFDSVYIKLKTKQKQIDGNRSQESGCGCRGRNVCWEEVSLSA